MKDSQRSSAEKLFRTKKRPGIVANVCPQGDRLYLIVRHPDTITGDNRVIGKLFGSIGTTPEEDLLLVEILVATDIDLSVDALDYSSLIGKKVTVEEGMGRLPRFLVRLKEPVNGARTISPEDIIKARSLTPDNTINDEGVDFLEQRYGKDQTAAVLGEKYSDFSSGSIIQISGQSDWQAASMDDMNGRQMLETDHSIVNNLTSGKLKDKPCHYHAKALTAK